MNADLPRMERVPAEGPTYAMRLAAATSAMAERKRAGIGADAEVVCAREGHAHQPVVAEVWVYGNDVLWRSERPLPSGTADTKAVLDAAMNFVRTASEAHGIPKPKGLSIFPTLINTHLLNVPPEERVESTEHDGITADADGNVGPGWHTSEWPAGTEVAAHCPIHGTLVPDDAVIVAAVRKAKRARGKPRVLLT